MAKWICFLMALGLLLCGCQAAPSVESSIPTQFTVESWLEPTDVPGQVDMSKMFRAEVCYVNQWGGNVYARAENADTLDMDRIFTPPIHAIDSVDALDSFIDQCGNDFSRDQSYNEVPSFDSVIAGKNGAYFEKNTLLIVAIPAGSGSFRYGVERIEIEDGNLTVHTICTHFPEAATLDLAGWFILVTVRKTIVEGCEGFNATLQYPQ